MAVMKASKGALTDKVQDDGSKFHVMEYSDKHRNRGHAIVRLRASTLPHSRHVVVSFRLGFL